MVDLYWADAGERQKHRCSTCPTHIQKRRMCAEPGFVNVPPAVLKRVESGAITGHWSVGQYSAKYLFCPGKATWFPELADVFEQCRIAMETGLLPQPGGVDDQHELFATVFPVFVERWSMRKYYRTWADVIEFTPKVLESIGKMIGQMFGGKK